MLAALHNVKSSATLQSAVIPAQAGISVIHMRKIPACAGMTVIFRGVKAAH